jgi:hypothetical protein
MIRVRACTIRCRYHSSWQIPVLPTRHPDLRKVILQHESQNQL